MAWMTVCWRSVRPCTCGRPQNYFSSTGWASCFGRFYGELIRWTRIHPQATPLVIHIDTHSRPHVAHRLSTR